MATQYIGKDKNGRLIGPGFASLSYKVKTTTRIFRFWPEVLDQPHGISGSTAQSHFFRHFYAKGYATAPVSVTGRVRDQVMFDSLSEFIRTHQLLLVTTRGSNNPDPSAQRYQLPLMTLSVPSEGLVYTGWIERFSAGAKRFNVAPQFTFAFTTIEDRHSTNDKIVPSYARRSVFTGAFLTGPVSQRQTTTQLEQASSASALTQEQRAAANQIKTSIEPGEPR